MNVWLLIFILNFAGSDIKQTVSVYQNEQACLTDAQDQHEWLATDKQSTIRTTCEQFYVFDRAVTPYKHRLNVKE